MTEKWCQNQGKWVLVRISCPLFLSILGILSMASLTCRMIESILIALFVVFCSLVLLKKGHNLSHPFQYCKTKFV